MGELRSNKSLCQIHKSEGPLAGHLSTIIVFSIQIVQITKIRFIENNKKNKKKPYKKSLQNAK